MERKKMEKHFKFDFPGEDQNEQNTDTNLFSGPIHEYKFTKYKKIYEQKYNLFQLEQLKEIYKVVRKATIQNELVNKKIIFEIVSSLIASRQLPSDEKEFYKWSKQICNKKLKKMQEECETKECIFENSSYYSPEEYRLIEKDVSPGSDTHCYTCMENRELNNLFIYMCHQEFLKKQSQKTEKNQ
ncbi:hypothetical protein PPERSA_12788 [Pseudocohnilembus persalinus]|uniref:Uncharacterized protein n=1 Tax=Pseudocohnilembus persalinus TaxID=266149 RepID=A0A0V0QEC0_PSEPJ|nr:hypothetical protein PPERSA_12788 [Pseudocohnilembus persalinus]|eukprot:KRX00569.1 hypothetical protein PPERSA_12788 [Pseudocohnilembus persalinus]